MEAEEVTKGSLSAAEVERFTSILTRHYGEPVKPLSAFCRAFDQWGHALMARAARIQAGEERTYEGWREGSLDRITKLIPEIVLAASKSNLLYRLLYLDQSLRTTMCPTHHGQWSGYKFDESCACNVGYDVTGWLE